MKITIYDLLGLIKEGKAPKKIDTYDYLWTFNNDEKDYVNGSNILLFGEYSSAEITTFLNDEVEVIEEEKEIEFEDVEEKDVYIKLCGSSWNQEQEVELIDNLTRFNLAINRIIRNQNKIIDVINDMRDKE